MNPDLSAGTQHIFDMAKVGILFRLSKFFCTFVLTIPRPRHEMCATAEFGTVKPER